MQPLNNLLLIDLTQYSPENVSVAELSHQLNQTCILLILEKWSPLEQQLLPQILDDFQQECLHNPSISFIIYQNWINLDISNKFNGFFESFFNSRQHMPSSQIMTLQYVEEDYLPSLLKRMAVCIFLEDNLLLMGKSLAMNIPILIPSESQFDYRAPFVYTYNLESNNFTLNLRQSIEHPLLEFTPRQFITNIISVAFQGVWKKVVELHKNDKYVDAWIELQPILLLFIKQKTVKVPDLKIFINILEYNHQESLINSLLDDYIFTTIPLVPIERSNQIYINAFRTCFEYIRGNSISGDVLEFGTYLGYTGKIIVNLLNEYGIKSHYYTYDSFSGFDEISLEDQASYEVAVNKSWQKGTLSFSERVADRLSTKFAEILPDRTHVVKGYFKDTLPEKLPNKPVVLVHIDCDLYSPSRFVLDLLLEHRLLQDGTVLLFDDYNCNRANPTMGERRALKEAFERQTRFTYSPWFAYGWGGQAIIVHDLNASDLINSISNSISK